MGVWRCHRGRGWGKGMPWISMMAGKRRQRWRLCEDGQWCEARPVLRDPCCEAASWVGLPARRIILVLASVFPETFPTLRHRDRRAPSKGSIACTVDLLESNRGEQGAGSSRLA